MDKAKLKSLLIAPDMTIKQAMKQLNDAGMKILFVVDKDEKLLGTLTDGDIRRGIIKGYGFNDQIDKLMKKEYFSISSSVKNKKEYAKKIMIENKIEQIPILDTKDTIVDVVMWTDILEEKKQSEDARRMLEQEKGATILYDLRSSWAVPEEIKAAGGIPYRERVGHAYMRATLREKNAVFGGELSGHYYFRDNYCSDSGMIAFLTVIDILSTKRIPFSNIVAPFKRYYSTGETNFEVEDKDAKIDEIAKKFSDGKVNYLDGVTVEYSDWWFNVRKSNTEPLLRLNLEGKTQEIMEKGKKLLIGIIQGKS